VGGIRISLAGLAALVALACVAVPARAESPADWLYEPTTFTEVRLEVPPASIKKLEEEPKKYAHASFSLAETNGTPGSAGTFTAPIEVGLELKGNLGSLRTIKQKAAFKIEFNHYVPNQAFLGLEHMTLNNMVQDNSMIHEATAYTAFHDLGVPAPHVGFSYLTINGESYGLHLDIESQDKVSLEKQFGPFLAPPEHLYEGEYGADATPERWTELQNKEGEEAEPDLEALKNAVGATSPAFTQRVGPYAELTEMTKDWLVEKYVGHWDGYAGSGSPNNYYLFSNADGQFQILPSGTDQTWQSGQHLGFEATGGAVFNDCVADASCKALYRAAGTEALIKLNALSLDTVARCTATDLHPWQVLEGEISTGEKRGPSAAAIAEEGLHTREFIASRPAELASFLGVAAPPKESGEPACPPLRPIGGFPKPSSPETGTPETSVPAPTPPVAPTPPQLPAPTVQLGKFDAGAKRIVVHLTTSGPGVVVVSGSYRFGGKKLRACSGHSAVAAAGAAVVTCQLTKGARRRLERGSLRLGLTASFTPAAGPATAASRTLRLRRG
jgi:hypothetical protein